jgi:hypothetical protein
VVEGFESEEAADGFVHAIARDWREAHLSGVDRALCEYAEKLTLQPSSMSAADVERLRVVGLDDRAIHDATQVIGNFATSTASPGAGSNRRRLSVWGVSK